MTCSPKCTDQSGSAMLLVLLALVLLSTLALFMSLSATTGLQISDNYESQIQATYAALAGINHARILFRGIALNDLLKGPDGMYDTSAPYNSTAKSFAFRNPVPLMAALSLDIVDPSSYLPGTPDDGIISAGSCNGVPGIALIPETGILLTAPDPYGSGTIPISRYFTKVSDNNGETSEIAGDAANNPFFDGDGIVIVRSLGVARTLSDKTGAVFRRNSIAVYEARFKRRSTWAPGSALVILGSSVEADFSGVFEISGGADPGIGTIDTVPDDPIFPEAIIRAAAGTGDGITGAALPNPSVRDITGSVRSSQDQRLLLDAAFVWDFIHNQAPQMADNFFEGSQSWSVGSAPDLGIYDPSKPYNAPGQDPKVTVVRGDLELAGAISGGGLLIVTGNLSYSGAFAFNGLVIIAGSGSLTAEGTGSGIAGGVLVANLTNTGGEITFGAPNLKIGGNSRIASNEENVRMAISLIPVSQVSFREIAGSDP